MEVSNPENRGRQPLYKFDGKVRVEYKNQDVFTGFLHDYDVFHPAHGLTASPGPHLSWNVSTLTARPKSLTGATSMGRTSHVHWEFQTIASTGRAC